MNIEIEKRDKTIREMINEFDQEMN